MLIDIIIDELKQPIQLDSTPQTICRILDQKSAELGGLDIDLAGLNKIVSFYPPLIMWIEEDNPIILEHDMRILSNDTSSDLISHVYHNSELWIEWLTYYQQRWWRMSYMDESDKQFVVSWLTSMCELLSSKEHKLQLIEWLLRNYADRETFLEFKRYWWVDLLPDNIRCLINIGAR